MSSFVYTENPETNDYSFKEVTSNFVCLPETSGNFVIVKNDTGFTLEKNGVVTIEELKSGNISKLRYENYLKILEELKNTKKY